MSSSSSQQTLLAVTSTFGPIPLGEEESFLFCSLFTLLDQEDRGAISIDDCVSIWHRAPIDPSTLKDIVDSILANNNRDDISEEAFALGCKLVAMATEGRSPDLSLLSGSPSTPLVTFSLASLPEHKAEGSSSGTGAGYGFGSGAEGEDFLKIEIDDSVTEGEGMAAFVRVCICVFFKTAIP